MSDEDVDTLSRDLCLALNRETDVRAELPEGPRVLGSRGDPVTIGTILLASLTSGSAVALFGVLKSYFERNSSLEMELRRGDGRTLKVRSDNLSSGQLNRTLDMAAEFLRVAG